MKILLFFYFVVLFLVFVYIGFNNRASGEFWAKVLPALAIGLTGTIFTMWFSLKEEPIERKFRTDLMTHIETCEALEKYDEKYNLFYGSKHFQLRRHVKYTPRPESYEGSESDNRHLFPFNVLFIETLTLLFSEIEQMDSGLDTSMTGPTTNSTYTCLPEDSVISLDLFEWLDSKEGNLSPDIKEIHLQLTEVIEALGLNVAKVPKGTSIKVSCDRIEPYINFVNDFCEVNIELVFIGGHNGLGEWQWILGYDKDTNKNFQTSELCLRIKAKFNKLRSGHPDMPKYKNWVNAIIDRLQTCLDSKQRLISAREKYHLHKDSINNHVKSLKSKEKND